MLHKAVIDIQIQGIIILFHCHRIVKINPGAFRIIKEQPHIPPQEICPGLFLAQIGYGIIAGYGVIIFPQLVITYGHIIIDVEFQLTGIHPGFGQSL